MVVISLHTLELTEVNRKWSWSCALSVTGNKGVSRRQFTVNSRTAIQRHKTDKWPPPGVKIGRAMELNVRSAINRDIYR